MPHIMLIDEARIAGEAYVAAMRAEAEAVEAHIGVMLRVYAAWPDGALDALRESYVTAHAVRVCREHADRLHAAYNSTAAELDRFAALLIRDRK